MILRGQTEGMRLRRCGSRRNCSRQGRKAPTPIGEQTRNAKGKWGKGAKRKEELDVFGVGVVFDGVA